MIVGVIAEELLLALAIPPVDIYVDPDIFPLATIKVPGFLLFEGAFDEGDTIYQAYIGDVDNSVYPPSVIDLDNVYAFTTTRSIAIVPAFFSDTDTIYHPIALSKVLGPQLFIDVDVFGGVKRLQQGKATINQTFPIDTVLDNDIIHHALVERSGVIVITQQMVLSTDFALIYLSEVTAGVGALSGSIVTETAGYSAPPLGGLLSPSFNSADTIWSADVRGPIMPVTFIDTDLFYAPIQQINLTTGSISSNDTIPAASVARGFGLPLVIDSDTITGPALGQPGSFALYVDAGEFIASPTIILQGTYLTSATIIDADAFYSPLEGQGIGVIYDPSLGAEVFLAPTVNRAPLFPIVSVVDPEPIYAPVVAAAPAKPSLVVDADAFFAPNVGVTQTLTAGIVIDSDTINAPTMGTGAGFAGTLVLDGPIIVSGTPPTVIYIEG